MLQVVFATQENEKRQKWKMKKQIVPTKTLKKVINSPTIFLRWNSEKNKPHFKTEMQPFPYLKQTKRPKVRYSSFVPLLFYWSHTCLLKSVENAYLNF